MPKSIIIIGSHPIADDLTRQYEAMGAMVTRHPQLSAEGTDTNSCDELCLLSDGDDNKAVALLEPLTAAYDPSAHDGRRLTLHLLLATGTALHMLQTTDLCSAISSRADVYPFTTMLLWSRSITPDYRPITLLSEQHVHLVIFGMGEAAQTVAIQTAHVAHYPNYTRDHKLRTRITMVDEQAATRCEAFISRYRHLFDNSYYRVVKPAERKAIGLFHEPMYARSREDFVDVEWEFVEAESWNPDLREKLRLWAHDERQLLTVVMAYDDAEANRAQALCLPDEIGKSGAPVHIYTQQTPDYDVRLPLVRMAKNVNYVYDQCYNENDAQWLGRLRYAAEIDAARRDTLWAKLKSVKRQSCICNAMTIPAKMRSIGLPEEEWDRFYDIAQTDIELLAEVEHNRWSVEELILGFRPCTDEEQDAIAADVKKLKDAYKARKTHYDLRAYADLRPDGTEKPVQVYDLCLCSCLPLIAKAFADEKGGGGL